MATGARPRSRGPSGQAWQRIALAVSLTLAGAPAPAAETGNLPQLRLQAWALRPPPRAAPREPLPHDRSVRPGASDGLRGLLRAKPGGSGRAALGSMLTERQR